jgi:hypothetical protein
VLVTGVLQRVASFFVTPAATPRREPAVLPPVVRAVVLGARPDAASLAAALALSLRAAVSDPAAVVVLWSHDGQGAPRSAVGERARGTRAALRLAARLRDQGLDAGARGRLAWLVLPTDAEGAAGQVRRASSLVEAPLVTALTGPRPPVLDDLVAEHDIAIVAAQPGSPLARATLAQLADRGIAASARLPLRRGLPRALALAGLAAPRLDHATPEVRREREW